MFKWLRDKINTGSENEYKNGLARNANFLNFLMNELPTRPEFNHLNHARILGDIDITKLLKENNELLKLGYSKENMARLLDLDMNCRRCWGNVLSQSDLKYNKTFDPK